MKLATVSFGDGKREKKTISWRSLHRAKLDVHTDAILTLNIASIYRKFEWYID